MSAIEQAARAYVAAVRAYDPDWRSASAATITDAHDALCAAVDAQPEPALTPRTPSWHWDASARTLHLWDAGDQPDDAQTLTGDTARRTVESLSWCVSEAIIRRPRSVRLWNEAACQPAGHGQDAPPAPLDGPRTPEQPQPGTQRHPNPERPLGDHQ